MESISSSRLTSLLMVSAVLVLGCSSKDGGGGEDTTTDGESDAEDTSVEAPPVPDPPQDPVFTPCPDGWREVTDGVTVCDPWPEGGMLECGDDEAHFVGEPGCTRVGTACPAGTWPEGLPSDTDIVYVQAGAAPGGDGTEGSPLATIAEGMAAASSGNVIALSTGTYSECVELGGLTLWGACPAQTIIDCDEVSMFDGVVQAWGAGNTIRNLTITGNRPGIWALGAGRILHVQDVIIEGTQYTGIVSSQSARITVEHVLVRDTLPYDPEGQYGWGALVTDGGYLQFDHSVIERPREIGIICEGSELVVNDTVIHEPLARGTYLGRGLNVQQGSTLTVERSVFSSIFDMGASISETTAFISDLVVMESVGVSTTQGAGMAIQIVNHSTATLERILLVDSKTAGIAVIDGTTVSMSDLVVRDIEAHDGDRFYGIGCVVQDSADLTLERALFERCRDHGIIVLGSSADLTDVVVRDTRGRLADGHFGRGLTFQDGATATLLRVLLDGSLELGLNVWGVGTTVTGQHVTVIDTDLRECADTTCAGLGGGVGLGSYGGAHIDLTDFWVEGSALCGAQLAVDEGAGGTISLHDGVIIDNPIGVNIQTDGFDIMALQDNVLYIDNDRNLDTEYLPVPSVGDVSF